MSCHITKAAKITTFVPCKQSTRIGHYPSPRIIAPFSERKPVPSWNNWWILEAQENNANWQAFVIHVASIFKAWLITYNILAHVKTYNEVQYASKLLATLCTTLSMCHLTTAAYHHQINGHGKRYNRIIVKRLQFYVAKNQKDWLTYVQPLTIAFKAQMHKSTTTITLV